MTRERERYPFSRRTILKTLGATTVASGALTGVSTAQSCDTTVSSGDSIQDAIDNDASPGEVVCVGPGTYDESVVVDKSDLTLHGPNAGLSGSDDRGDEAIITRGVTLDADGVTLDGFQVESEDVNGVRLENPVDDITIQNTVVTNVDGGTFGARAGGNGVQIQLTGSTDETANNISIHNNKISEITTPDNDNGRTLAIGVNVLPRGNDVVDLVVDDNEITNLEPGAAGSGASKRARAISVDTQLDGSTDTGRVDGVEITNNDVSKLSADRLFAVSLFEDGSVDPRRGVEDFLIERNDFDDFSTTGDIEAAIFIGGYEKLGEDHEVTLNNFNDGFVERFNGAQSGYDPNEADSLSAECNYWGHATGPQDEDNPQGNGQGVVGPVDYRPWSVRKIGRGKNPENSCVGGKNDDKGNGQGN